MYSSRTNINRSFMNISNRVSTNLYIYIHNKVIIYLSRHLLMSNTYRLSGYAILRDALEVSLLQKLEIFEDRTKKSIITKCIYII